MIGLVIMSNGEIVCPAIFADLCCSSHIVGSERGWCCRTYVWGGGNARVSRRIGGEAEVSMLATTESARYGCSIGFDLLI